MQEEEQNPSPEDPTSPEDQNSEPALKRPRKLIISLAIGPIVAMTIAANIANAFFPSLLKNHALVLLGFDARARNVLLVSASVAVGAWFFVALIRRVIFHPLYFLLGRWYGDAAIRWIAKRSPDIGALIAKIEEWFPKFGPLIVAFYAHPLVCVMAGASKMKMIPFIIYNVVGNIIELLVLWQISGFVKTPLQATTNWIGKYSIPLTVLTFVMVAFYMFRNEKSGTSTLESVGRIEEELEEETHKKDQKPAD